MDLHPALAEVTENLAFVYLFARTLAADQLTSFDARQVAAKWRFDVEAIRHLYALAQTNREFLNSLTKPDTIVRLERQCEEATISLAYLTLYDPPAFHRQRTYLSELLLLLKKNLTNEEWNGHPLSMSTAEGILSGTREYSQEFPESNQSTSPNTLRKNIDSHTIPESNPAGEENTLRNRGQPFSGGYLRYYWKDENGPYFEWALEIEGNSGITTKKIVYLGLHPLDQSSIHKLRSHAEAWNEEKRFEIQGMGELAVKKLLSKRAFIEEVIAQGKPLEERLELHPEGEEVVT